MSTAYFPITPVDVGSLRPGQRPDYIEQVRSEIRGEPYRPAKRRKPAKPLPDAGAPGNASRL